MPDKTEILQQCREEICRLVQDRVDRFTNERRKARKSAVRKAMFSGFMEGFCSLGDGLALIGGFLCGRARNKEDDPLRDRVSTNTHGILDRSQRDWEKAYTEFWESLRKEENEIAVKYGFSNRDDFCRKWKEHNNDDAEQGGSTGPGADDNSGPDYTR